MKKTWSPQLIFKNFLLLAAPILLITAVAQAQIRIVSHRLVPNPPLFGETCWLMVDFENGEVEKIYFTQGARRNSGIWGYDYSNFPPHKRFAGKQSGTLPLFHSWREDMEFSDQRSITIQLVDKQGKTTKPIEIQITPTRRWKANSPIKLLTITAEPDSPKIDGERNWLNISYGIDPNLKPEWLYVQFEDDTGKVFREIKLSEKARTSGEIKWWWTTKTHGERSFKVWLVDDKKVKGDVGSNTT